MANNWTADDERRFNEMKARRDLVLGARFDALYKVTANAFEKETINDCPLGENEFEIIASVLSERADDFRDALLPYDSGVRPQESGDAAK